MLIDIRLAARSVLRAPAAAAGVILAVALGIGVVLVALGTLDGFIWRPLPYPADLVGLARGHVVSWNRSPIVDVGSAELIRQHVPALKDVALVREAGVRVRTPSANLTPMATSTTPNAFAMLGATPMLGRVPDSVSGDNRTREVAVGEQFWRNHLGGRDDIVGSTLIVNGSPAVVVGVMPSSFLFYFNSQLWFAMDPDSLRRHPDARLVAIGQLRDDATIEEAQLQATALERNLPSTRAWEPTAKLHVMDDIIARNAVPRPLARLIIGVVLLILVVACANVANLLFVRTTKQRSELAIRAALGGGPAALIRPGLVYGAFVITLGGAMGLLLASAVNRLIANRFSDWLPEWVLFQLDARFLVLAAVLVILAFAATSIPALRLSVRPDVMPIISSGNHTPTRQTGRINRLSLIVQVAIMCAVTVTAAQIWGTYRELIGLKPGFPADELLALDLVSGNPNREPTAAEWSDALNEIAVKLANNPEIAGVTHRWSVDRTWEHSGADRTLPNVESTLTDEAGPQVGPDSGPVFMSDTLFTDTTPLQPVPFRIAGPIRTWAVGPEFFRVTGIDLLSGRAFTTEDDRGAARVTILSEALAEALWPDEPGVGRRLRVGPEGPWLTVVGTSRSIKSVRASGWEGTLVGPEFTLYLPQPQAQAFRPTLLVRQGADATHAEGPLSLASVVQRAGSGNAIEMSLVRPRTYSDDLSVIANERKSLAMVLGGCAIAALLLGSLGLFSMLAFYSSSRLKEFGIRSALGASRRDLARALVLPLKAVMLRGVIGGLLLAIVLSKLLEAQVSSRGGSLLLALPLASIVLILTLLAAAFPIFLRVVRRSPMVVIRDSSSR